MPVVFTSNLILLQLLVAKVLLYQNDTLGWRMRLHCVRLPQKLTTKWKLLFLALTAAASTLIIFFICWPSSTSSPIPRRPKTLLIYNNEHLCSSNATPINSQNDQQCRTSSEISIVIVVPSCRENFMQRNLIRQTYGSIRTVNNVTILAVVFMLGNSDATELATTDLNDLHDESVRFGDIIVGDLVDTYRNLSRKSVMAYEWLTSYCRNADLIVKTDDDVLVDIFKLTAELSRLSPAELKSYNFWCAVHSPETIDRNPKSIYYVSRAEYAHRMFPEHCAGVGYVASMRLVHRIADEISRSFRGQICSHEDVFITGIVPRQINSNKSEIPVKFVNKMSEWIFYIDANNPNEDGKYIWNVINQPVSKTVDLGEFRKRSGTRVFYLLEHGPDFERRFSRLWHFVETSFRNK